MIYIASDHGGYKLKKRLVRYVKNELKLEIEDMGPNQYDKTDDYPDFAIPLTKKMVKDEENRGVLICRNGIGVCILANKVKGVRAGIGYNLSAAQSMRNDDDTNVLCLAADHLTDDHAMAILKKWLETPTSKDSRHLRRRRKVTKLEKK